MDQTNESLRDVIGSLKAAVVGKKKEEVKLIKGIPGGMVDLLEDLPRDADELYRLAMETYERSAGRKHIEPSAYIHRLGKMGEIVARMSDSLHKFVEMAHSEMGRAKAAEQ